VFDLYKVHQDATLLPVSLMSDDYAFDGRTVPAVSASASRDAAGRVHITLVNADPHRGRSIQAELRGVSISSVTGQVLTGSSMNAHNTFESPDRVRPAAFSGARVSGTSLSVDLPPMSVVVLEMQ
jgi:alpha-N-arabinofuranosidase